MDMIDIAIAKAFATKVAAGFSKVEVDGMTINFTLNDGSTTSLTVPTPADGVSVTDINIDENGNLICTMSDETEINAGKVLPEKGVDYYTSEEIEEIETEIKEDLQESVDEVQTQVTRLRSNFDRNTPTPSDNLTIEDAINDVVEDFTTIGKTSQNSYTGKNLIDGSNPTGANSATIRLDNDVITISSTSTITIPYANYEYSVTENDVVRVNGVVMDSNGRMMLQEYNGASWVSKYGTVRDYTDGSVIGSIEYTVTAGINKIRLLLYANKEIPTSAVQSKYKNVILTLNNADMSYEPYVGGTISPNPNYPQPIENVTGDVKTETSNKNRLDRSKCFENYSLAWATGTLYKENGSLASDFIRIWKNTLVIQTYQSPVLFYNKNKEYLGALTGDGTQLIKSAAGLLAKFTVPNIDEIYYMRLCYRQSVLPNIDLLNSNIQVEFDTQIATNYIEHQGKSITFPLAENQKLMQGDYLAEDGIHHVRGQVVFDGTENWISFTIQTNSNYALVLIPGIKQNGNGMSNYFIKKNYYSEDKIGMWLNPYGTSLIQINFPKEFETLNNFKTWLAEQYANNTPVIVEYELQNEVIEPYTEAQQTAWNNLQKLETYKNITHIYTSSDGLSPDSKITYLVNPLSSIEARLSALEA